MKVITVSRFGDPDVLTYEDVPSPPIAPNEARVRVALAGVNFGDVVLRSGNAFDIPRPYVPGIEAAGIVQGLGSAVRDLAVGSRVAVPLFTTGRLTGGYASEVVFDAERLVPVPDHMFCSSPVVGSDDESSEQASIVNGPARSTRASRDRVVISISSEYTEHAEVGHLRTPALSTVARVLEARS